MQLSLIALALSLLLPGQFSRAATSKKFIQVQGHRGARGFRPENTLPAFQFALDSDVDALELDIAVSKDNQLVISHEPTINPEICVDENDHAPKPGIDIHSLSLLEIKKYDCGSVRNPRFPEQTSIAKTTIPLLSELFEMVKNSQARGAKTIQFNIETKIFPGRPGLTPDPETFARMIIDLVRKYGWLDRVTLESFDDRTLLAAHKIAPRLRTVMLIAENHVDLVAVARAAHASIISPDFAWILPEDVRRLHRAGIQVIPWTANEPAIWEALAAMGVDGIISDYPTRLLAWLKERKLHSN